MRTAATVIFVHIPKTAGTTLRVIIERFYRRDEIYATDINGAAQSGVDEFKRLDLQARERIRLLIGHMDFGLHDWVPRPYLYITLLREPIDLVTSEYYFAQREPKHPSYSIIHDHQMSLKDYLETGIDNIMSNSQTRMLSGRWTKLYNAECPPQALEEAKHNLRTYFSVVGLTGRFDETLLLLKAATGWDHLFYIRRNETSNRPKVKDLPPATLQAVQQANALDIELYRYATELFNQQVENRGASFARELSEFQSGNRRYAWWQSFAQLGRLHKFYRGITNLRGFSLRATLRKWFK
jgi:hypothetical protein